MLKQELEQGVAVLTLDRPERLNAFNDELGNALLDAVREHNERDEVRCIVVTGSGRAFCSGEDLAELQEGYAAGKAPDLGKTLVDRYNPLVRLIRTSPKPVIAALNGVAAGAGASIALACDFRIASEHAKLILAFIKVGLVPDSGAVWFLSKMLGAARAWELAATGKPVGAQEALELGLVTQVLPAEEFERGWKQFALEIAEGPTKAFALTKALIQNALVSSLDESLELEVEAQTSAGRSDDHLEGVQAFFAKRPPKFSGR